MSKRLTILDDHVALVLSNQLADELMSLMQQLRKRNWRKSQRVLAYNSQCEGHNLPTPTEAEIEANAQSAIAGDIILAILEAKE